MRALLDALTRCARDGKEPPPSNVPHIADASDTVRFPSIPANVYGDVECPTVRFLGVYNPLHVFERGAHYLAGDISSVMGIEPPQVGTARYGALVPQVDTDGNDIGGVRSAFVQVNRHLHRMEPVSDDWFPNGVCRLAGSFVPFAATKAECERAGDPRLSREERVPRKRPTSPTFGGLPIPSRRIACCCPGTPHVSSPRLMPWAFAPVHDALVRSDQEPAWFDGHM